MDLIEGGRTKVTPAKADAGPSPKMREVISDGAQIILKDGEPRFAPNCTPFGDASRPSASLLFVPVRCQNRVMGVLTLQSYTPQAYAREDLDTLQALADHCGSAIQRIHSEELLRRTEELYRRAIRGAGAVPYAYVQDITERKQAELTALAMSKLGQSLISATTLDETARVFLQIADELFGWDACAFYLYSPETDLVQPVLNMDTIDGQRVEVPPPTSDGRPDRSNRRAIEEGAELTLKDGSSPAMNPGGTPFGDKSRPSASIMRVPLRLGTKKVTGIVAIHSYTPQAYSQKDLKTLQTLAYCCGVAVERI
jgi:GAF domain-containing protein